MIGLLLLLTWMACGITAAVRLSSPSEPRWAWAPIAAVVGPLWVSVALDQRREDQFGRCEPETASV